MNFKKKATIILLLLIVLTLIGLAFFYVRLKPQHNRDWQDRTRVLSEITKQDDGSYQFSNIRNWTYTSSGPIEKTTTVDAYHPDKLTDVWFVIEPFYSWDGIAHTYLTFDFEDEQPLSFSIEARMEKDEDYSPLAGMFKQYELAHVWGYESDLLVRRVVYLENDVYMYKLTIPNQWRKRLFEEFISDTQQLHQQPEWYDTVTDNCTNALAQIVNGFAPGTLPFDRSWFFTGYSGNYLQSLGFIDDSQDFSQLKSSSKVNEVVKQAYLTATMSAQIREYLE